MSMKLSLVLSLSNYYMLIFLCLSKHITMNKGTDVTITWTKNEKTWKQVALNC